MPPVSPAGDLDHDVAVDAQRRRADGQQRRTPSGRSLGDEPAAGPAAEVEAVESCPSSPTGGCCHSHFSCGPAIVTEWPEASVSSTCELAVGVEHRQRLADEAAGLERHVVAAAAQRVQRPDDALRA